MGSMGETGREFIENVMSAVEETERRGLLTERGGDGLTGISGDKTVGAIQRLVGLFAGDDGVCYLEIGVYQGLTLVSAALEAPDLACFGIDNFATLDPEGENERIARERIEKFDAANATLIDADFEDALLDLESHLAGRRIGVYFIDGPHDYRSQMACLLLAKGHLAECAVIIVDDANYPDVRRADRDFLIGHDDFKMLFEAYSPAHPANMEAGERKRWEDGWLNGVNILVRDPGGVLGPMLPPVDDDRTLFFNEWLVHRLRLAELAPEAVGLAEAVCSGDDGAEKEARAVLLKKHELMKGEFRGRFADRNTYSAGLTEGRFARMTD